MNLSPLNVAAIAMRLGKKTVAEIEDGDIDFVFRTLGIDLSDRLKATVNAMLGSADPGQAAVVWLQEMQANGGLTNLLTVMEPEFVWLRCPHCALPFDATSQLNAKE